MECYKFYSIIDSVVAGLTARFNAAKDIDNTFGFLWKYRDMTEDQLEMACRRFSSKYKNDVAAERLKEEVMHLRIIHEANFGDQALAPLELLNEISRFKLEELFGNVCTSLRIFCSLPVTVASAERSFSKLSLIKNFLRSTMTQVRLNDLAILSIESELARNVNFSECIDAFAARKARRVQLSHS